MGLKMLILFVRRKIKYLLLIGLYVDCLGEVVNLVVMICKKCWNKVKDTVLHRGININSDIFKS
jgi:hypothetical protein